MNDDSRQFIWYFFYSLALPTIMKEKKIKEIMCQSIFYLFEMFLISIVARSTEKVNKLLGRYKKKLDFL